MEAIVFWLVLLAIICVPIYYFDRWRNKKDNGLALDRIAAIQQLLFEKGFVQVDFNDLQYGKKFAKLPPTSMLFHFNAEEDTSVDTLSIACFINRPDDDNLNISFAGYSGKIADGTYLGELSFLETRLRRKNPRLCVNKTVLEEVFTHFRDRKKQNAVRRSSNPVLQNQKVYGPLKSSLNEELKKAPPSQFSLAYASLYFALAYILLGVSGASISSFLTALLLFSVTYILLVWRYRYLREESFKWKKRRWTILAGIGFIPGGMMVASLIYPFNWEDDTTAVFLFFSIMFGLVHGYLQMAFQSFILR